jgi:Na+-translocating ferredoxin:NAD+ oxidoreductase RnfC subunit
VKRLYPYLYCCLLFVICTGAVNGYGQSNGENKYQEINKRKVRELEKEYKKALKHHKKIQGGRTKRIRRKHAKASKKLRLNKKRLFPQTIKGGSHKKGIRRLNKRKKVKSFQSSIKKGLNKIGDGLSKIGALFKKIKLPKPKWPSVFKKK